MNKRNIDIIYEKSLSKYNNEINKLDDLYSRKCVCCKGCSACCHQLIIITDFEKELLKYTISTLFRKEREKLYKLVKEQCLIMENNNLNKNTINPFLNQNEQQKIQQDFFRLNLYCPFLKEKSCSIYDRRPISCMTYRNYGNSKECEFTINVSEAYTFNDIEVELRKEIFSQTNIIPKGFNVLQFAILELIENGEY